MPASKYRVRIVRGDQEFEAEGDKAFVLDMLKRFESPVPSVGSRSASQTAKAPVRMIDRGKGLSPSEFIRQIGFKRHIDIVLAFGYYLEHELEKKEFTPADVNNLYYDAKMENSNTSQMCISNIRRAYMMEARGPKGSGRKKYTLTRSGEEHVRTKFAAKSA